MGIQLKSLVTALALGFALLFFGPAVSTAQAAPAHAHAAFRAGRFHGRAFVGPRVAFGHPYPYYPYPAPYRVVRVLVPFPFPHWVARRVYAPYPYGY